jgi:butyryl-CoA dehydrogenase
MDFILGEEQKMLQTMVREFAEKELEPVASEIDETGAFPADNIKKMAELGLMGVHYPEKYGGSGGGQLDFAIATEEISRVCASTGAIYFVTAGLAAKPIFHYGTEDQKKKYLKPLAAGEKIGCFALTEAGAGSDAGAVTTKATKVKAGYKLEGNKIFITNGNEADIAVVFATLDKSKGNKGICAFVVEKDTPGFKVGKLEHKMGIRASSTAELVFEDCVIPESNLLGEEGKGLHIAMDSINRSRVSVAAQALGIAQAAFDKALEYTTERSQFGSNIGEFQAIQWMLADMATQLETARLIIYKASWLEQSGMPFTMESSMAKLYAAQTAHFVTDRAIQIFGGYGYVKDYPLERYYRDARICGIYEGTDEMQRMTIARQLLKDR